MPLANILSLVAGLIEQSSHLPLLRAVYAKLHAELVKTIGTSGADLADTVVGEILSDAAGAHAATVQPSNIVSTSLGIGPAPPVAS